MIRKTSTIEYDIPNNADGRRFAEKIIKAGEYINITQEITFSKLHLIVEQEEYVELRSAK